MPRFTVRDLLVSTTLIAAGLSCMGIVAAIPHNDSTALLALLLWFSFGAFIGAGLFLPFHRPALGAAAGFAVTMSIWFYVFLTAPI